MPLSKPFKAEMEESSGKHSPALSSHAGLTP